MEENKSEEIEVLDQTKKVETINEDKKKQDKNSAILIFAVVGAMLGMFLIAAALYLAPMLYPKKTVEKEPVKKADVDSKGVLSQYRMTGNNLEDFDLAFLKLENNKKNDIYSPLSIKYALAMLKDGSNGETKEQIESVIGDYKSKKYTNDDHMSFANAMFIRNSFKDKVKNTYTTALKNNYYAEVIFDDFNNADNMNNWVSNKTFKLINDLFDSNTVKEEDFILTNALAIDMNWNNLLQAIEVNKTGISGIEYSVNYKHEKYSDYVPVIGGSPFKKITFNGKEGIEAAEVGATINKYDIVKELGEDKIRKIVGEEYKKWLETDEGKKVSTDEFFKDKYPTDVDKFLDKYVEELNSNYKDVSKSTDFSIYDDKEVKVFAKELKEYSGTRLQYIGIMPKNDSLEDYIKNVDKDKLNTIIGGLKTIELENFKDGVITKIHGNIPFFKFDHEIDLTEQLPKLGIKNIFDINKADLSNMLVEGQKEYIGSASHKATIEFSNEGIKASAATSMGGRGGTSAGFQYDFEVPVEEIDITFDKPYMFIIRDTSTGEVWFTGSVYEPTK